MAQIANKEIQELFCLAQHGKAKHKKYLNKLRDIFQKQNLEEFLEEFMRLLLHAFNTDISNVPAKSVLDFASSFCVEIVTDHDKRIRENNQDSDSEHPFFVRLVEEVLKYVPLTNFNVRCHACQFLALLFGKFGSDIGISDGICDSIQKTLLERILDLKPQVRCQTIQVLLRLQNTQDANCPVIESFINSLIDPVASVRKLVVESIAPSPATLSYIITRLRDVDASVRGAAFTKLSKITPKILTIVYRQSIIMSGLVESNVAAKEKFENELLPKWLRAYDSNVIKLMDSLKLDAHEEDVIQTEMIYKNILPIIFKMLALDELLELLNLDDAKLVPLTDLSIEKVNYWSYFINYLKETKDVEFDDIIPVLTNFATYIESFIKLKSQRSLEHWEDLEYQQILRKLFEMLLEMDVSDEFGKQEMQKVIVSVLINVKLKQDVIGSIIKALHTIITDVEQLTYELCTVITDIKDPPEEEELPIEVRRDQEIQIAQLKVKLHLINDEMKDAVQNEQYRIVDNLTKDAAKVKQQMKEMEEKFKDRQTCVVKKCQNDMEALCRCMDIVLALMENIRFEKVPVPLLALRQEFFSNEQIDARHPGIYEKIFRMTCLFAILDKQLALESTEIICTPIISYKLSNQYHKNVLKTAVGVISDMIRIYGPDIFNNSCTEEDKMQNSNVKKRRGVDRTLYSETDSEVEVSASVNIESITVGVLMDIILDMLDDTTPDIREHATVALIKLVVRGLCVNSSLLTRLLLKWFNPILNTEDKHDQRIQQCIGIGISKYISTIGNAPTILEQAMLPIMCSIGNAPKTSPLSEVEYDDVLHCLIKFTKIRENSTLSIHKHVAYSILDKVNKINEPCVRILSKMLLCLDIPGDEPNVLKELSQEANSAIDNVTDKISVKYLKKYFCKLNGITNEVDESANTLDGTNTTKRSSTTSIVNPRRNESTNASEPGNMNRSASASEIDERTPAKRRIPTRTGEEKALTTPGKRRNRKQSDETNSEATPRTRNRKQGETLFATPARENRRTNLDTIEEKHEEVEINTASSKNQAIHSDSSDSNDSVFAKEDEEQIRKNKLTTSVKRRKIRGKTNNSQAEKDDVNAQLITKEIEKKSYSRGTTSGDKQKSNRTDGDALYSHSSSETENVPEAPPRRKSQRKL